MWRNKIIIVFMVLICIGVAAVFIKNRHSGVPHNTLKEMHPVRGNICQTVTTTGIIEPQNRLEIRPSISGRIEEILVHEGDTVAKGDILAWMSSTERAALVDAAGFQGEEARAYWEDVYKKTPIISPIQGEVIVRSVEPGQTVVTSDAVLVLSDRLIISAQFDETDIGKVRTGQRAIVSLDAYPEQKIDARVDHIAYESEMVNNVTIYDVDIVPHEVPSFFRSGMSANVEVIKNECVDVLTVPMNIIQYENGRAWVMVKQPLHDTVEKRYVEVGLSDTENIEIISGLQAGDTIVVQEAVFSLEKNAMKSNPFMPSSRKRT